VTAVEIASFCVFPKEEIISPNILDQTAVAVYKIIHSYNSNSTQDLGNRSVNYVITTFFQKKKKNKQARNPCTIKMEKFQDKNSKVLTLVLA